MPTPPIPGWKLPVAVGSRSPIFSVAFTLSTDRICGACSTLVRVSLRVACSRAPGSVIEKSELAIRPRFCRGMAVLAALEVLLGVVVVGVPVLLELELLELLLLVCGTVRPD